MSGIVCPKCGGSDIRQITPGFFECESEVQIGWRHAPPEVTGAGFQRLPVFGACRHEFEIGARIVTPPCSWPECGRDCAREHAAEREPEAKAARAANAEAIARARAALEARLTAVTTADELLQVLHDADGTTAPKAACREAWLRLVVAGEVRAGHEIVEVRGRGTVHGWLLSRFGLTSQRGSWFSPAPCLEIWPSSDGAVWLDAEAVTYRRKSGGVRLSIQGESRTRHFVLPKVEGMVKRRRRTEGGYGGNNRWFEVVNGTQVAADTPDEDQYTRTLKMILENLCAA